MNKVRNVGSLTISCAVAFLILATALPSDSTAKSVARAFTARPASAQAARTQSGAKARPAPPTALDSATIASRTDKWLQPYVAAGDFRGVILIAQGHRILEIGRSTRLNSSHT